MRFSRTEKRDLLKSWIAISIAFAIVMSGGLKANLGFFVSIIISAITVGLGFLVHELSHKLIAQRYGCWAEYRSFDKMLLFMIVLSFFGFIFAAPGAVMIQGHVGKARNGRISAAGPFSSIVLGLLFFGLYIMLLFSGNTSGIFAMIAKYGMIINAWLALFNLLPFGNFDGKKVLNWNRKIYGVMMTFAVLMVFFAFYIL